MTSISAAESICRFGIARCDITPPVGIYHRMWGAATHDRSTGIHRPLTATAMVFRAVDDSSAEESESVWVAVDHCLLWAKEMDALLHAVSSATGLSPCQLLVLFSHTHAAGLMGLERVGLPGGELIPQYLNTLAGQITTIVRAARENVAPATITYGVGRSGMAGHRDFWDAATGQYVCGFNPAGPADDSIQVARVMDPEGVVRAIVVNYACHPTTLAWENTLISPDYPGAMREVVEQAIGAPCVFLQGASGDLGPRHGYVADTRVADSNGRQLGFAVLSALESLPPPGTQFQYTGPVISGATLGTWAHTPIDDTRRSQRAHWQLERWATELAYRDDLPVLTSARSDLDRWKNEERQALAAGNPAKARDARAMAERLIRVIQRLMNLPPGERFPMPATILRIGQAVWLAIEGEHYQLLQRALREQFPQVPIVVATLANGARSTYLPTRETYGNGIYQEGIALVRPGSLEYLIETIAQRIRKLLDE